MSIVDSYPLFTVSHLAESRAFFVQNFGFQVLFEASWVAMLGQGDGGSISLGLMSSNHPSTPPGPEVFGGRGMLFTVQVDDAEAYYRDFAARGIPFALPLTDAPWGQRRFMVTDPSGIQVDVVEQIEPAPGFWEQYSV